MQLWQCDCVDSLGQTWAAGSLHYADCNNCSCIDGQLLCTNHSCQSSCIWSSWSSWASCSVSCGRGQRTRYRWGSQLPVTAHCFSHLQTISEDRFFSIPLWVCRSLIPDSDGADCQFEEVQHKPCHPGTCPPLCLHDGRELSVGHTWLQGECKQW